MRRKRAALGLGFAIALGFGIGVTKSPTNNEEPGSVIEVVGEFGAPVKVEIDGIIQAERQISEVEIAGTGRELVDGEQILFRATSFDHVTGRWTEVPNSGALISGTLIEPEIGRLYEYLVGQREGSRLVILQPDLEDDSVEVVVVDLLHTRSTAPKQDVAPTEGRLIYEDNESGLPIASGKGKNHLDVQNLVLREGSGQQVRDDDQILANYRTFDSTGKILEDTWQDPRIPTIALEEVYEGLRTGLTDQRVGSRVAIYVPAQQAHGSSGVRIVVDVLGIIDREGLVGQSPN